jgi:hypothetical protein
MISLLAFILTIPANGMELWQNMVPSLPHHSKEHLLKIAAYEVT